MISIPLRYKIYLANLNPTIGGEIKLYNTIQPVIVEYIACN